MIIKREWAMPNKETFKIAPIDKLLKKYVGNGDGWIDPFAGNNSPAYFTNDLNPKTSASEHSYAEAFVKSIPYRMFGVLFDPPYSLRQIKECYESIGLKMYYKDSLDASFSKLKDIIAPVIVDGGYAISFGWNTNGFGKNRGFEIVEILLVAHGGHHNDTICTVERKINQNLNISSLAY